MKLSSQLFRYLRPLDLQYLPYLAKVFKPIEGPVTISETQAKSLKRLVEEYYYSPGIDKIFDENDISVVNHLKMQLDAHLGGEMQLTSGMIQICSKLLHRLALDVDQIVEDSSL